jgi:hypothetical protein
MENEPKPEQSSEDRRKQLEEKFSSVLDNATTIDEVKGAILEFGDNMEKSWNSAFF